MEKKRQGLFYRILLVIAALAILGVAVSSAAQFKSELMGPLPEFQKVFTKLFRKSIDMASMDQIKAMYEKLSAAEKAALANYMPQPQWEKALEGAEAAKNDCPVSKALAGPEITLEAKLV